ncbi:MAG: tetratricopeptide repeat protein [Rikenellaceae bacterium]
MHKKIYIFIVTVLLVIVNIGSLEAAENVSHLVRGKELYRLGRWGDARLELLKAKSDASRYNYIENQDIDFYITLCHIKLEDNSSRMMLDAFELKYPNSIYTNLVGFNRGLMLCTSEDYKAAYEELNKVDYSELATQQREEYDIRMGYLCFLDGDYVSSLKYFDRISQKSEYYSHALYYKSYIDYAEKSLDSAKAGFTELLMDDTYREIAPFYLLQIEFQQGNYDYVIENGGYLMRSASQNQKGEIARTVAEAHFRKENYEGVIENLTLYQNSGKSMSREDNYTLGFALYRTTNYNAAIEYLKKASGADDELTQNASYHLADCYLRSDNKNGAMQAFAMASSGGYNPQITEDALFNYGKLKYELGGGLFNEAINILTRYTAEYPKSPRAPEAKKLLVAAYYNSNNYDAAYKAIKEVSNPDADIKSALQKITYFKALEYMKDEEYASANKLLMDSERVGISPKYVALSKFWQGEISYIDGSYDIALKNFNTYLSRAPKSDPTYTMALYSIAYALLQSGNEESAQRYFQQFVDSVVHDSEHVCDAYNRMGDISYKKREFSKATDSYTTASKCGYNGSCYANYQLAMIDGIQGFVGKKIDGLKNIISANKGEYVDDAEYELGRTYMSQEMYRDGVNSLKSYVDNYPNGERYAQALSDLGLCYLNLGDKATSITYYNRAIDAAPQSAISKDALQGVRDIYISQGDADGYFKYAETMGVDGDLSVMAKDSLSFASAQRLYLSGEDSRRTTNAMAAYVKDYPKGYYLTDALFLLGDCHLKNGDNKEAVVVLTRLSKMGDNQYSQRVLERLSKLTYDMGRYDESAIAYRKLYDVSKGDSAKSSAMEGYAVSIIATKDRDKILKMANDILSQPKSGAKATLKAKHAKATILRENGEWEEAVKLYRELSGDPRTSVGAESTYYLINNAHRSGDIKRAEDMIFSFAESQTTQAYWLAKAFITLGDIYVANEDNFQARATYQSIVDGYATSDDGIIEEAKAKIEKLK